MNSSNIYYPLSGLINVLASVILGIFVLFKNRSDLKHITYALFCLSIAVWSAFYLAWLITLDARMALFCCRGLMAGAIFIPIFYFHHICSLLGIVDEKRFIIKMTYLFGIVSLAVDFTPYFVKDVIPRLSFKFWPTAGTLFTVFLPIWGFIVIYGAYIILKKYTQAHGPERNRIKYVLIATLIGWVGGATNFPLWYNFPMPPMLNILVSAYVGIIAYAIVRHQLMDIDVALKKTLVFAGLFAFVYAVFAGMAYLSQEMFQNLIGIDKWLAMVPSVLIVIFMLKPLEKYLVHITDRYLFQKKYDYKELLKTFTAEVLTVLNLNNLINLTLDKLVNIVRIESCSVLLRDEAEGRFGIAASYGINDKKVTLFELHDIVKFLENTHGYILMKDLEEKKIYVPPSVREVINGLNAELVIPMLLHEKMIGALSLGKKKSDEGYTQDDLDILLPLARTLAIAISNAELFEELGKTQAEAAQKEKMAVIGTLSAGINHEICNPLGIARGQCEAFLLNIKDGIYKDKSPQELVQKAEEVMAKVIKETDRATAITKKLSSFAKPAKGEAELVDINKELDEVFGLVGYELKLEKVEFDKRIDKGLPRILVDRKQFQEVLFNLIRNAGQAIGEKGRISVSAKEEQRKVVIEVQDTGSGIPENRIKELFNPFFTTKDPGKGTGLGLFIVRQVVEKNGGKIYLKNTKVGVGTTFTIEFPVPGSQKEDRKAYETADSRDRR